MNKRKNTKTQNSKQMILSISEFEKKIKKDNFDINLEIEKTNQDISDTKNWLTSIKNSRFYKLWQKYNQCRKIFYTKNDE